MKAIIIYQLHRLKGHIILMKMSLRQHPIPEIRLLIP